MILTLIYNLARSTGREHAAPRDIDDKERAVIHYPDSIPSGLSDGKEIPDALWLLIAFERDGKPLEISRYEKGRLVGEGLLQQRLV